MQKFSGQWQVLMLFKPIPDTGRCCQYGLLLENAGQVLMLFKPIPDPGRCCQYGLLLENAGQVLMLFKPIPDPGRRMDGDNFVSYKSMRWHLHHQ